jgi:SecD/SecF fusion protein
MNKDLRWKFAVILAVLGVSLWFAIPWKRPFPEGLKMRFGLDLQGGTEILYKLALHKLTPEQRKNMTGDAAARIINIIEQRINAHGMKEFKIRKHGSDKILIQLPGSDEEETQNVKKLIETSGKLEFRLVADTNTKNKFKYPNTDSSHAWLPWAKSAGQQGHELIQMEDPWDFTGEKISSASPSNDDYGYPAVSFTVAREGRDDFESLTGDNVDRGLAMIMDGKILSAPVIRSQISEHGQITGKFTIQEQDRLITVLQTGSFPVDLDFESMNRIGPGLGSDSIAKGIRAIAIACALVLFFIAVYYLGVGMVANFALMFNLAIVLGFMTLFGATLTLPGIAGILLTVGMAVDANILIYERIREEKAKGKTLQQSVKNGYDRAFVTILDANITTLFTAAILYLVGTGAIKGFAVTLSIGILASMFTALFVTRAIFDFFVGAKAVTQFKMLSIIRDPRVGFIRQAPKFMLVSVLLIGVGLLLFAYRGEKNLGIDFKHGTLIDFNLKEKLRIDEVRQRITTYTVADEQNRQVRPYRKAEVQEMWEFGTAGESSQGSQHFEVRISESGKTDALKAAIETLFAKELIPAPFSEGTVTPDLYRITFDFDLQSEAKVKRVIELTGAGAGFFPGELTAQEQRSYCKGYRFKSDLIRVHPDRVEAQRLINARIAELKTRLAVEFEFDGAFPKNLDTALHADLSLRVNMAQAVDATRMAEILKVFKEAKVEPSSGQSASYRIFAEGYKSRMGEDPFGRRIQEWKDRLRSELKKDEIQLSEPIPRVQSIGPVVASELTEKGTWAIILSLIVIVLYITFRFHMGGTSPYGGQAGLAAFLKDIFFKARYGFAAIAALVHDVLITLGAIAIFAELGVVDVKIDLQILAAFLTIIGYSLNDTIVVFDRIRENVQLGVKKSFGDLVNGSINQTLSRTLLTSTTTFIVVFILFLFGGRIIKGFSFALLVGVVVGTYSSIFIASPVLVFWEKVARTVKTAKAKA